MSLHPKPRDLDEIRTADPVELSTRVIDEAEATEPTNRVSNRLSEINDDIAIIESFSHMIIFRTEAGLVSFDASLHGDPIVEALRGWRNDRIDSLIYTHGHIDHVGGSGPLLADAERRGHRPPDVIGHDNVVARFERYERTNDWNRIINRRQFGGISPRHGIGVGQERQDFVPVDTAWPDRTYRDRLDLEVGGLAIELHHGKGETDDHTWAWIPEHRAICPGDLVVWVFPNAGNPQKVQRFPGEWAAELRKMLTLEPELLLPAHGLPIRGRDRIARVLTDMAEALEGLVEDTLAMMNSGATLDEILHTVRVDPEKLELPWLKPVYDEPGFVVRNIWRLYGGWWDGNPAHLKPAPEVAVAGELAELCGGVETLAARAEQLASSSSADDLALACHLIEFAVTAAPHSASVHGIRAEIYRARRAAESSLMSKGIFAGAMRESDAIVDAG